MYMKQDLKALGQNIVYIKPISTIDLPAEVRAETGGNDTVFAVHNTLGEQVALVANPGVASELARQNALELVRLN